MRIGYVTHTHFFESESFIRMTESVLGAGTEESEQIHRLLTGDVIVLSIR